MQKKFNVYDSDLDETLMGTFYAEDAQDAINECADQHNLDAETLWAKEAEEGEDEAADDLAETIIEAAEELS